MNAILQNYVSYDLFFFNIYCLTFNYLLNLKLNIYLFQKPEPALIQNLCATMVNVFQIDGSVIMKMTVQIIQMKILLFAVSFFFNLHYVGLLKNSVLCIMSVLLNIKFILLSFEEALVLLHPGFVVEIRNCKILIPFPNYRIKEGETTAVRNFSSDLIGSIFTSWKLTY